MKNLHTLFFVLLTNVVFGQNYNHKTEDVHFYYIDSLYTYKINYTTLLKPKYIDSISCFSSDFLHEFSLDDTLLLEDYFDIQNMVGHVSISLKTSFKQEDFDRQNNLDIPLVYLLFENTDEIEIFRNSDHQKVKRIKIKKRDISYVLGEDKRRFVMTDKKMHRKIIDTVIEYGLAD